MVEPQANLSYCDLKTLSGKNNFKLVKTISIQRNIESPYIN